MLVAAAFWRPAGPPGSLREVWSEPQLAHYVAGWPQADGFGVIALDGQQPVGAAWARLLPDTDPGYGFVDATTPECRWVSCGRGGDGESVPGCWTR